MKRAFSHPRALMGIICVMVLGPMTIPSHSTSFSYDDWNSVLERYVSEDGLVDYAGLAADRENLDRFISLIETTGPETQPEMFPTRQHQLAFYINAYNAHVFKGVLNLSPKATTVWGFTKTGYGFFVRMKFVVDGRKTHLKALEDDIIRGRFKDPRIHAALNCASVGCPKLPREAFTHDRLDEQLDAEMTKFVSEDRNCRIDKQAGTVTLSKIFDWFRKDFEGYEAEHGGGGLREYINRYRPSGGEIPAELELEFATYDKTLNRQ